MENNKPSCCAASRENSSKNPDQPIIAQSQNSFRDEMIQLPGGNFLMGTDDHDGFPAGGEGR